MGSLALLTFSLGATFDSLFFTYVAVAFSWTVFALWCVVAGPTLKGFLRGTLFPAPCLASLPPEYVEKVHPTGRAGREEARARAGKAEGEAGAPTPRSGSPGLSKVEPGEGQGGAGRTEAEAEGREPVADAGRN